MSNEPNSPAATLKRSDELFCEHQNSIHRRTDRMFAYLMVFQWVVGIAAAVWISPRTWIGAQSHIHIHVWAAIFIGGAITSFPVWLVWKRPGQPVTRHAIAVGQMLTSALLIHLTGGRIETHFHVFGSLAFLAIYRDWKVLLTATVVVATDHFLRGVFWPQSVFGVLTASHWRWVEHAGWVIFEDIFLMISIRQSVLEMHQIAERQARLEALNQGIENVVQERTRELEQTHKQLIETSRKAGMAEVATSVLHNVGNVLNSVNVSISMLSDQIKNSKTDNFGKLASLMQEHAGNLGGFITNDPRGQQLPKYISQLADYMAAEKTTVINEIDSLRKNVDHVKDIVAMQQTYARVSGVTEVVKVTDLVEDALRMNASALIRHDVHFFREYNEPLPEITVEKHKALQILVNLIRNAKQACDASGSEDKRLTMRVTNGGDRVRIALIDNGIGIPAENLSRVFNHGFTTKKDGHGFGLHSSCLAAKEMQGTLTAHSDGTGKGATFTLELPCQPQEGKP
ncbi:MAG TPA: ATP-binding protein [Verrucomicrobiae bacterium]|jgi:signal transduction histidine kinase|nr:ATP-binding protein [Verrucomicrobiae bacterium]